MSEKDFDLFIKLREWRKEEAAKEGAPVYTIFTNAQLAEISEKRINNLKELENIEGVGKSRCQKYGEDLIKIIENYSE